MIQRTPRLLCIDEIHRKLARVGHCILDGLLGDLRELHPEERHVLCQAFLTQDFVDVPGNRFSFAIEVRGQVNRFGFARCLDDGANVFLAALVEFIGHRKVVIGIHRAVFRGQIPDMTIGGQHLEILSKITVDSGRFGRRFYDQKFDGAVSSGFLLFFINGGSLAPCQTSDLPSRRNSLPGRAD